MNNIKNNIAKFYKLDFGKEESKNLSDLYYLIFLATLSGFSYIDVSANEQLIKIAKQLDDFLKENNADRTNYYRPLEFNEKLVETYSNKIFSSFLGR